MDALCQSVGSVLGCTNKSIVAHGPYTNSSKGLWTDFDPFNVYISTLLSHCVYVLSPTFWSLVIQGPVPSYFLFVLLEFRQLNLLSRPLSLSELLFQHYLPPKGDDYEKVCR